MDIVITGGMGFIGRKLAACLRTVTAIPGPEGLDDIDRIVLFDSVASDESPSPRDTRIAMETGDITDPSRAKSLIGPNTGAVFHLAAIVSGEAEANFDLGMRVNVDGTRNLLEACRALPRPPRVVFSSSVAVYGGERTINDHTPAIPFNSYGIQKVIGELLVNDYSRKGFIDGRVLRLPTIAVRPGKPNKAASSFVSSIVREPLSGKTTSCPVGPEVLMPILSPRRVTEALVRALFLGGSALGANRILQLPAIAPSVGDIVEAVRRAGGEKAVERIKWQPDPRIQALVEGWPQRVEAARAESMGFVCDQSVDEIISAFVADELGGTIL